MWKSGNSKDLQAFLGVPVGQLVAVAVDSDKNSHNALKWAADHFLSKNHLFYLVHVRRKISGISDSNGQDLDDMDDDIRSAMSEDMDYRTKELLIPFQVFCSRKGLQCKEIILDDTDVPKAIVNFVTHQNIDKLILGASSRNALTRTFRQPDIPTSVSKNAPDFCSIYVISKGKVSSVRPASRPNVHPVNRPDPEPATNQFQSIKSEPEMKPRSASPRRSALHWGPRVANETEASSVEVMYDMSRRGGQAAANPEYSYQSIASCPSPCSGYTGSPPPFYPREYLNKRPNTHMRTTEMNKTGEEGWSNTLGSSAYSPVFSYEGSSKSSWSGNSFMSNTSVDDVDSEIRRLRQELDRTLEIYEGVSRNKKFNEEVSKPTDYQRPRQLADSSPDAAPKKTEPESNKMVAIDANLADALSSTIRYRRYTMEEIQKATDDFSDALKIGEGGYGPVYKSTLDHTVVAIKILKCDTVYGMKQFHREVEVLSCIRHPNMVLLMGACPEYGCLVYEFMANGSLEDRLFCLDGTPPLSWQQRFKIAAEIATGLLFLHQTKPEPLVHRDLKPANILLDHNLVSKIADVGLARIIPPAPPGSQSTQYHMTAAAGTFCYIDPEYQKTGMLGIKSDVYALGIILLQLITGSPPMGVAHNVERAFEKGTLEKVLDPKVPDWPMEEIPRFAKLALKCAELRRRDRPDLGMVVLPELNRLRALAESSLRQRGSPWMHSRSYKESRIESHHGSVSEIQATASSFPELHFQEMRNM